MKWCKYHGIETPASFHDFKGNLICGYLVEPGKTTAACTSQVREVETWELDEADKLGTRARVPADSMWSRPYFDPNS